LKTLQLKRKKQMNWEDVQQLKMHDLINLLQSLPNLLADERWVVGDCARRRQQRAARHLLSVFEVGVDPVESPKCSEPDPTATTRARAQTGIEGVYVCSVSAQQIWHARWQKKHDSWN
jgi:hypothetical protein